MTPEELLRRVCELHHQARLSSSTMRIETRDIVDLLMEAQRKAVERCLEIARSHGDCGNWHSKWETRHCEEAIALEIRAEFADVLEAE